MAEKTGIGFSTYRRYEAGGTSPPLEFLAQFSEWGYSLEWLISGTGEKEIPEHMRGVPIKRLADDDFWISNLEEENQKLKALLWDKDQELRVLKKSIDETKKQGERNPGHDPSVNPA